MEEKDSMKESTQKYPGPINNKSLFDKNVDIQQNTKLINMKKLKKSIDMKTI